MPDPAMVAGEKGHKRRGFVRPVLVVLLAGALLALAWRLDLTPTLDALGGALAHAQRLRASPFAVPACLLAFVIGGLVAFPVNLLIAASVVVLGPWLGGASALTGVLVSALVLHSIGRRLPQRWAAVQHHPRWRRVRERLLEHGIVAVAFVRLVPVGPYSIISVLAGVMRVRLRDYLIGTALGMLPGIVVYAMFADRARAVLADPGPATWIGVGAAAVLAVVLAVVLARSHGRTGR